jgi:hypothetical protein|eukprot:COSAG02_NODE_3788_length_6230_cov_10.029033_3_plen_66_part_00
MRELVGQYLGRVKDGCRVPNYEGPDGMAATKTVVSLILDGASTGTRTVDIASASPLHTSLALAEP